MDQTAARKQLNRAGIYYLFDDAVAKPEWEVHSFHLTQVRFPFFTIEPPVLLVQGKEAFFSVIFELFKEIRDLQLQTQVILFNNELNALHLRQLFNEQKPFRVLDAAHSGRLEQDMQLALETARKSKQDKVLMELFHEQNRELKKISQELEDKIDKRQRHLQETREKLFSTNRKTSFLQHCLFTIHNSHDLAELESHVTELLKENLNLLWFRILFSAQSSNFLEKESEFQLFKFPLLKGNEEYGTLVFGRDKAQPFKREDKDFLEQIGEAMSLCIDRLLQIERNNELQSQWQSTFNAISDSVCLIDENYNLRSANKKLVSQTPDGSIEGKKCYQALFNRESPCTDCHRGAPFRLRDPKETRKIYDVFSQTMTIDYKKNYFHVYRDISKQLGFERQLMESAKLAELGTISSSIAHELNNPLGGMLNFIQLIKMDLKGDEVFYQDVVEMENGANKCKNIVQNLLGFSRHTSLSENQKINIEEILQRSIMITELRTRALGIQIRLAMAEDKIFVLGRFNQLAQVFCNILQNAFESLLEKRRRQPDFTGLIEIDVSIKNLDVILTFQDDGIGLDPATRDQIFDPLFTTKDPSKHSGLGLTLAQQILRGHSADIQINSQNGNKTCFQIRFPALGESLI